MSDSISELERLLCGPSSPMALDDLMPRQADAWDVQFPSLNDLPDGEGPWRKLRCCIATEEIAGPVRNGGIGSTYAALAELLAQLGHDCTILYLRGAQVETGDIDQWVAFYAAKGVKLVPTPDYAEEERLRSPGERWLRAPYNMMRYLQDHPMDVVHVSEWRGCGYLSLLAKRQGLAFDDTLFLVKTSSPWMWNRLYGAQAIERLDDLTKTHAERRSVELADLVIGGSLHLIRWMSSQGYRIPQGRTFVQPNVVSFESLKALVGTREVERGARKPFDEIVFFGRLEARKGLAVFCQAINRLIRIGQPLPPKITFMGKAGARLPSRPDLTSLEYIAMATKDWPMQVQILADYQQLQALEYLVGGPRLAVMPSVIENSSMAIYEAAICGIPCVASDVGGNMELVEESDWPHVFCKPHPLSLSAKLAEAIELGGYVPSPSFDNDDNLDTWRRFHEALACGLRETLLADVRPKSKPTSTSKAARRSTRTLPAQGRGVRRWGTNGRAESAPPHAVEQRHAPAPAAVSVCIYASDEPGALRDTLMSLKLQTFGPLDVSIAADGDRSDYLDAVRALGDDLGLTCRVVDAFDLDAGAGLNLAAHQADGAWLLFLWEGAVLRPEALAVFTSVAEQRGADVLTCFHGQDAGATPDQAPGLSAGLISSVAEMFFSEDLTPRPLWIRRAAFDSLGGFTGDYRAVAHDIELIAKAQLRGLVCETVLRQLTSAAGPNEAWLVRRGYDLPASRFRLTRPLFAAAPLVLRELLLMAKGLQARGGGGAIATKPGPKAGRVSQARPAPASKILKALLSEGAGSTARPRANASAPGES